MDSRCKAKLIDYLQSPLVKQQILEKVMQDPIIQEVFLAPSSTMSASII